MALIFIDLPETKLTFHLFDKDVDSKMLKKLSSLGLADIAIKYPSSPSDAFINEGNGLYRQGEFACESLSITSATEGAVFSTVFNPQDNTVQVALKGRFFCFGVLEDVDSYELPQQTVGFVSGIRLNDNKGKLIRKPKDDYGMRTLIEALVEKETYNNAAWLVNFKIIVEDDIDN